MLNDNIDIDIESWIKLLGCRNTDLVYLKGGCLWWIMKTISNLAGEGLYPTVD